MHSELEKRTLAKVTLRLIPFMIFLYLLNYLDRVNISCAQLQMNTDLKLNDVDYSWAVAAFYVGYCLFEVPSNLVLARVGARLWISRIMISWGIVSALMLFSRGPWSFFGSRFLLGCAEAGFFPGMILYLTYWIPQRQRASASAWFLTSTALAGVVGNPLAGYLMGLAGPNSANGAAAARPRTGRLAVALSDRRRRHRFLRLRRAVLSDRQAQRREMA